MRRERIQHTTGRNQALTLIDEIIRMSDFHLDRLPMLDIIGDRMVEKPFQSHCPI